METPPEWIHEVLRKYQAPLIRYAMTFTRDFSAAQDVVQDTFLRLVHSDYKKIEARVAPWLFTVCRNRALDMKRKDKNLVFSEFPESTPEPSPDPARLSQLKETRELILALLETLPANQQEVVRLKFQGGMSYKEISTITRLSVSNVGYILHHALRALKSAASGMDGPSAATGRQLP